MMRVKRLTIPGRDVGPANRHIDRMEGTTTLAVPSSTVWRELATGREYGAIVGGLAWPCHPHEGALVVLGLEWDGLRPVAHVLAEVVNDNLYKLLERYFELSEAWGLLDDDDIRWIGSIEHEMYEPAVGIVQSQGRELLLVDLAYKQPPRWLAHCNAILDALNGQDKRLYLDDNDNLRTDIGTLRTLWDGRVTPESEKLPRLVALGCALEGLAIITPPRGVVTVPARIDPWDEALGQEALPDQEALIPTLPRFDAEVFE